MSSAEQVIQTFMGFSASQLAVVSFVVAAAVGGAFWVENRYAKIKETEQKLHETESNIKRHKDEIIQMHIKTTELIKLQPKEVQAQIEKNSTDYLEQLKRLEAQVDKK